MGIPPSPVTDGPDLQPQPMVLGDAVEVVDDLGLINTSDMVQIIEEQIGITSGEIAKLSEDRLVVEDVSMKEIGL